jgi:hypothetical protein
MNINNKWTNQNLQIEGEYLLRYGISQSSKTMMNFIEKIGHERPLFGSNIPFGTMEPHGEPVDPKNHTYLCQCLGGSPAGERNLPKHGRSIAERAPIRSYAFLHGKVRACTPKCVTARRRGLLRRRMKWELGKVSLCRSGMTKRNGYFLKI